MPQARAATLAWAANSRFVTGLCAALLALAAFSVDMLLPALPAIEGNLGASATQVKGLIPLYFFGFGAGQLFFGALADKLGRRAALLVGLGAYMAGCLLAACAPNLPALQGGRLLQGAGAACAPVAVNAVLRDLHSGRELARRLAAAFLGFAFAPLFAPLLGHMLGGALGWRAVFGGMFVFAAALFAATARRLPETLPQPRPDAMRWRGMAARARAFFACGRSRFFVCLAAAVVSSMHLYLANAQSLYEDIYGVAGMAFVAVFAAPAVAIVGGQTLNRVLIRRFGALAAARAAACMLALVAGALWLCAVADALTLPVFVGLICLFVFAYLALISNATALAIEPHPGMAGFAASLFGFCCFAGSAVVAGVALPLIGDSLPRFAAALFAVAALAAAALLRWRESAAESR